MDNLRSTKKQRELLNFVDTFIQGHGYGPSYREIMRGLGYKSVSTVAIHIDNLIQSGYLNKRDRSARSLEVISTRLNETPPAKTSTPAQERWLVNAIVNRFEQLEEDFDQAVLDDVYVLIGALKVLELEDAHLAMKARLIDFLKQHNQAR